MRSRSNGSFAITLALVLFGCSSPDELNATPSDSVGGFGATGGAPGGSGGARAVGGSTMSDSDTSAYPVNGGSRASGGSPATGGLLAAGGRVTSGGGASAATGGLRATGGAIATGGVRETGGATASGGSKQTGGSPASGGTRAAGGGTTAQSTALTGGAKATGGTSSTAGGGTTANTSVKKFVGNITTGNSVNPSGLTYSKYWDQITPENQGKWGSVQSAPTSAFNWSSLDSIHDYAKTNNIIFKQHCFVWGAQQPSPMSSITLAQVENWIKSFCERYPDTKLIDVVNEPPPHTTPGYTAALGAGEGGSYPWITKAFKLARKYCGNAVLILNDYNNIENGDEDRFINIVKDIKANGAPIDAVGAQSHGLKGKSASTVKANLDKLNSQTGLPVYITEFDIDDANDTSQSNTYQSLIPVFLDSSYVHGVTVWGWIAGRTWETNSGIVNGTSPRPAMTWLMQKLGRPVPPN